MDNFPKEIINMIIGSGHVHRGPYSLWISGNNEPKAKMCEKVNLDLQTFINLSQVNKSFLEICYPLMRKIKTWKLNLTCPLY